MHSISEQHSGKGDTTLPTQDIHISASHEPDTHNSIAKFSTRLSLVLKAIALNAITI
jgi:hypothetical protein